MDTESGAEEKIKKLHFSWDLCLLIVRLLLILKAAEHSDISGDFISEMLSISDFFLLEYAVAFAELENKVMQKDDNEGFTWGVSFIRLIFW